MAGSWKKTWSVRSYPEAVARTLKAMPRIYEDGARDGVIGWVGRTFARQRKDFRPKPPRLSVGKGSRLVFQHDLIRPVSYTVECRLEDTLTRIEVEVRFSGSGKEASEVEQVVALMYALTKALEPIEDEIPTQP